MDFNDHISGLRPDKPARVSFFRWEIKAAPERNKKFAAALAKNRKELEKRRRTRETIALTCMDERNCNVEESLGLLPGEAEVYGSAGARLDIETFEKLYGKKIEEAVGQGKEAIIYLTLHACADDDHLGCAAFMNDVRSAQEYFDNLRNEIAVKYPEAKVNVVLFDTSTHKIKEINGDIRDFNLKQVIKSSGEGMKKIEGGDAGHAGHGIYVGDAYRAWVPGRNSYFRLSALNPDLYGNVWIALKVMKEHSNVDLPRTPIVLHVDYPKYGDEAVTLRARKNIDALLTSLAADPKFAELKKDNGLYVVKSETDIGTWEGKLV